MIAALKYLGSLPDKTLVYPGHEYTGGNVAFARSVVGKGSDGAAQGVSQLAGVMKEHSEIAGVTTIGQEKTWNVFMQLENETVRSATGVSSDTSDEDVMDKLRDMKNNFRG
ncbi:hypothetical protein HGRIS_013489 [Hohenbuehelia grisea]|uniref:hydroxyacylglutathione hydrolase n=1 Tax=Hohenbuehelia grisea TaxID=104357 RepID=A0ABR3IVT0_9AGAR